MPLYIGLGRGGLSRLLALPWLSLIYCQDISIHLSSPGSICLYYPSLLILLTLWSFLLYHTSWVEGLHYNHCTGSTHYCSSNSPYVRSVELPPQCLVRAIQKAYTVTRLYEYVFFIFCGFSQPNQTSKTGLNRHQFSPAKIKKKRKTKIKSCLKICYT